MYSLNLKKNVLKCVYFSAVQHIIKLNLSILAGKGVGENYAKDDIPPQNVVLVPRPKYGGINLITLLTGSTLIGQQGAVYIKSLLESAKVPVAIERLSGGNQDEYVISILRNRIAMHIDIQHDQMAKQKTMRVCNDLDLYACIVKMQSFPGFNCKFPNLDIVLMAQNNTGDFSKLEYLPVPGVVETLRVVTDDCTKRFLKFSFEYARQHNRKKITFGHKRTELPLSDGHFIDLAFQMQKKQYCDIEVEEISIDRIVRQMVMDPARFDMVCTNDRYGTFVATICSSVCGGAGLFSATELGDHHAIFKPLQTKLSLTNYRTLCPYGIVTSCVDLLRHVGNENCADNLWCEMLATMQNGIKTQEFGGTDSGEYVICAIVNKMKCK